MKEDAGWHYHQFIESAEKQNYKAAKSHFNKAIELDPHNTAYRLERGGLLYNQPDYVAAQTDYEIVIQYSNDEDEILEAYKRLTGIGLELNDNQLFFKAITWLIDKFPANESRYILRGLVFLKVGEYSKALDDYNKALKINHNNFNTLLKRGFVYLHIQKYEQCIEDMVSILCFDNLAEIHKCEAYHFRGFAYYQLERFDEALQDANRVLHIHNLDEVSQASGYYEYISL